MAAFAAAAGIMLAATGAHALSYGVKDAKDSCYGLKGACSVLSQERGGDERGRRFGPRGGYDDPVIIVKGPRHGDGPLRERPHRGDGGKYGKDMKKPPYEPAPVPLPAAGWLLAAGLGGLTLARKRKG